MKKQQNIFCNYLQKNNILCGLKEPDGKVVLEKLILTEEDNHLKELTSKNFNLICDITQQKKQKP